MVDTALRDYWRSRHDKHWMWTQQAKSFHNLPFEVPELAWCSECHSDSDYSVQGEPRDYDTNSGGYGYASECCGADVYSHRYVLPLSPGRTRYIYTNTSLLEYDAAEDDCDFY